MDTVTPRRVGKSRLAVTPLGFGGGTIGSAQVDNEASFRTVAAAWETGVRFYDTAPWYGLGRSERRLGLALAGLGPRHEFRVNTKIGKTLVAEPTLANPSASSTYMYAPAPPEVVAKSSRLEAVCRDHGVALSAAALQFPLAHPAGDVWVRFKEEGLLDERAPTP